MTIRSQSILLSIKKLCSKFQKTTTTKIMVKRLCAQHKGQLISKGLFAILEFFQKNERNNSIIVLLGQKNEFIQSFFGRIIGLKKTLRLSDL